MRCPRPHLGRLLLAAGVFWVSAATVLAQPAPIPRDGKKLPERSLPASAAQSVPWDELPQPARDPVRRIIEQPTLSASGPVEEFTGHGPMYLWLLDHPDRAAQAWRRLGAPCLDIADRGQGRFGWSDQQGSDLSWETVYRSGEMRIWYAEGRARPGLLLPPLGVRAVVVLRHGERLDAQGRPRLYHQADLFLQTDSKTAGLMARLIGPTAPRLTEQCVTQLELFFSALTCYLNRHPERAEVLFFGERPLGWLPREDGTLTVVSCPWAVEQ
ncbi:MAG: hypothetical protein K2R98_02175 [Gemmataceae bacterium]|nr:hypothetical protein [Gemmataceae bacterium]